MDNHPATEGKPACPDSTYFLVVGLLLVMIIASLAVLWVRERKRRLAAEAGVARLTGQKRQMQSVLEQFVGREGALGGPAVRRTDLPSRVGLLDGQRRAIFTISVAAGERVGFEPGDVIVVAGRPATSPATRRSGG